MRGPLLILLALCWPAAGSAAVLEMAIGEVAGAGWRAQGVTVQWDPHGAAQLRAERIALASGAAVTALRLDCPQAPWTARTLHCDAGRLSARVPQLGTLSATVQAAYRDRQHWSISIPRLDSALGQLALQLEPAAQGLHGRLSSPGLDLAGLSRILPAFGIKPVMSAAGRAAVDLQLAQDDQRLSAQYRLALSGATLSEPSGRYATDKLGATASGTARFDGRSLQLQTRLDLSSGQIYLEPVFADLGAHALHGVADLAWTTKPRRLQLRRLSFEHEGVAAGELSGTLDPDEPRATADLQAHALTALFPGFFEVYVKPFLAGKPYEDLQTGGRAELSARLVKGAPARVDLTLQDLSLDSQRLDLGVSGIGGSLSWDAGDAQGAESRIGWRGGRFGALGLGGSELRLRAGARALSLTAPFRQAVFDGALDVNRLELRGIGTPALEARFDARVEPISLEPLCRALGWPPFSGTLSGALPGLHLSRGQLALDGALTAEAFDGAIAVTGLRVSDALGPLPQLAADVRMRNLDLAALTGVFSFGRIEGRLDVDVDALRLLAWRPVAFQARLGTPPDDSSRHRISQRAIDNISSIGGGPTGLLSRGFMSLFKDFSYDRIGLSCTLSNGVCRMDGIAPGPQGGYYLVKGSSLPRIDIIGYAHEVSWDGLLQQVDNVRHAQKPVVR